MGESGVPANGAGMAGANGVEMACANGVASPTESFFDVGDNQPPEMSESFSSTSEFFESSARFSACEDSFARGSSTREDSLPRFSTSASQNSEGAPCGEVPTCRTGNDAAERVAHVAALQEEVASLRQEKARLHSALQTAERQVRIWTPRSGGAVLCVTVPGCMCACVTVVGCALLSQF